MLDTTTRANARSLDSSLNNASADMKVLVKDAQSPAQVEVVRAAAHRDVLAVVDGLAGADVDAAH